MLSYSLSSPNERTKHLLLNRLSQSLFKNKNFGITNHSIFSMFSYLLHPENPNPMSHHIDKFHITTYDSFLALKTIYLEEDKPESLLSSYLEIDLLEKIKKENSLNNNEFLKVLAYRNIPLAYHRNIRVIEILYEKSLSLYHPFIIQECPFLFEDKDFAIEEKMFHKIFDFLKDKLNKFQGNMIHEMNCRYGEVKIDVCSGYFFLKIIPFFKQHLAKRYFFDVIPLLDQYVKNHYKHFSLEKIWSEYLLASFFRILGNDNKAKEKLDSILDWFQRIYGSEQLENSDILISLSNIIAVSNQTQALEYTEKALKLRIKNLGQNHLKVAYAFMNLGSLFFGMKNLDKAMWNFEKALKGFEVHYCEDYPWDSLGYTLFSLGNIHGEKKNLKKALSYYKSSLKVYNNFIIPNDIMVVTILGILNKICMENGNYIQGYGYSLQALKIIRHGFGVGSEKSKTMRKSIKRQQKIKEISTLMNQTWVLDSILRKGKTIKRKEIINEILCFFTF